MPGIFWRRFSIGVEQDDTRKGRPTMAKKVAKLDKRLNDMILDGRAMAAFEEFYDDDVIMEEPRTGRREGKEINRGFEQEFFDSVEQVHNIDLVSSTVENEVSFSEWRWDLTFKDGKRIQMEEVARRRWDHGQVVNEKFYYTVEAPTQG